MNSEFDYNYSLILKQNKNGFQINLNKKYIFLKINKKQIIIYWKVKA
jgi:hypothetical protein